MLTKTTTSDPITTYRNVNNIIVSHRLQGKSKFTYENRIFLIIFILFTYEITYEKKHT